MDPWNSTTDAPAPDGIVGRFGRIVTPPIEELEEIFAITLADDRYQEAKAALAVLAKFVARCGGDDATIHFTRARPGGGDWTVD